MAGDEFEGEAEYGFEEGLEEEWADEGAGAEIDTDTDTGIGTEEWGDEDILDLETDEGEAMEFEDFEELPEFDDD